MTQPPPQVADMIRQTNQTLSLLQSIPHSPFEAIDLDLFATVCGLLRMNSEMWCTVSPLARYCDWVAAHAEHEADVGDVIDQICDEQDTEWRSCYGIGVLLVQSSINHACEPNTTLTFDSAHAGATITLQSRQQIEVGQEITISYIEPGECYKT